MSFDPPSVVAILKHSQLHCNCWMEFDETLQEASARRPLPSSGRLKNKDGRHLLWLADTFWLPCNLTKLDGSGEALAIITHRPLYAKLCSFGPIRKQRWLSWLLIGGDIIDFSATNKRNLTKLDGKQVLNVLYSFCFVSFGPIGPSWPLFGWYILDFSATAERILMKLDRKQAHDAPNEIGFLGSIHLHRWYLVLWCTMLGPLGLLFFFFWKC